MSARVIVADDESIIRMDLVECLTAAGYTVVGQASDGQEALRAINSIPADVAILDIKMPLLDGIEVTRAANGQVPVVLLTAFGQTDIVTAASEAGVMGYLIKPFNEAEVIAALEIAMSRFRDLTTLAQERDLLTDSLETRKVLDRAKGLLQSRMNMSEPDAFRWLQKAAMDRRMSVREVADSVIAELTK